MYGAVASAMQRCSLWENSGLQHLQNGFPRKTCSAVPVYFTDGDGWRECSTFLSGLVIVVIACRVLLYLLPSRCLQEDSLCEKLVTYCLLFLLSPGTSYVYVDLHL